MVGQLTDSLSKLFIFPAVLRCVCGVFTGSIKSYISHLEPWVTIKNL